MDHQEWKRSQSASAVSQILRLCRKRLGDDVVQEQQARLHLVAAVQAYDEGDFVRARHSALKSLSYSVGIHSATYKRAAAV
jgi:hypothetical protein